MASQSSAEDSDNEINRRLANFNWNHYSDDEEEQSEEPTSVLSMVPATFIKIMKETIGKMINLEKVVKFTKYEKKFLQENPQVADQINATVTQLKELIKEIEKTSGNVCEITANMIFSEQKNFVDQDSVLDSLYDALSKCTIKTDQVTEMLENVLVIIKWCFLDTEHDLPWLFSMWNLLPEIDNDNFVILLKHDRLAFD